MKLNKVVVEGLTLLFLVSNAYALQGPNAHFDTDKAEVINAKEIAVFAQNVSQVATDVTIYCHTDTRASFEYNRELADRRCDSVQQFLTTHGLVVHRVSAIGEDNPLVDESVEKTSREALNRRVAIHYEIAPQKIVLAKPRRHRIRGLAGYAPSGLKSPSLISPGVFKVKEDWDIEFGLGYSFLTPLFKNRLSIGLEGFTNKSGFLVLGFDL